MASLAMRQSGAEAGNDAGRLFAENRDDVFRHCLRRLGSRTDAEDAVQTTFLYALRALRRGEIPESETAWLIAIATNVCRSQHRSAGRRGQIDDGVDLEAIPERHPANEERQLVMDLPSALAAIPERQRHALLLREWRGLPTREVASVLGMSATATHALLTRARQSLAHALVSAPRTLALNLVGLAAQLRSQLAGWLGGAAGKTVAASVLAAGVGIGGVATHVTAETRSPRPPSAPVAVSSDTRPRPRANASASSVEPAVARTLRRTGRATSTPASARPSPTRGRAPAVAPATAVAVADEAAASAQPAAPERRAPSGERGSPAADNTSPEIPTPALPPLADIADKLRGDGDDVLQTAVVELPLLPADVPDPGDTVPVETPKVPETPLSGELDGLTP